MTLNNPQCHKTKAKQTKRGWKNINTYKHYLPSPCGVKIH